jgi:hypothetical protein
MKLLIAPTKAYEQLWINKLRCVNKVNPFYIKKLSKHAYYEANKESLNEQKNEYREANKTTMSEKSKAYYKANKEAARVRGKAYRETNKAAIAAKKKKKHDCECGGKYTQSARANYYRTAKHTNGLAAQQ